MQLKLSSKCRCSVRNQDRVPRIVYRRHTYIHHPTYALVHDNASPFPPSPSRCTSPRQEKRFVFLLQSPSGKTTTTITATCSIMDITSPTPPWSPSHAHTVNTCTSNYHTYIHTFTHSCTYIQKKAYITNVARPTEMGRASTSVSASTCVMGFGNQRQADSPSRTYDNPALNPG